MKSKTFTNTDLNKLVECVNEYIKDKEIVNIGYTKIEFTGYRDDEYGVLIIYKE